MIQRLREKYNEWVLQDLCGDVGIACTTGWVDVVDTNLLTGREKGKCRYAVD